MNPKLKPYSYSRVGNKTMFFYGETIIFDITNMEDYVSEAIVLQLNIAFNNGHEITMNSWNKKFDEIG